MQPNATDNDNNENHNGMSSLIRCVCLAAFFFCTTNKITKKKVATQCKAAIDTGVLDGCFFDWWSAEDADRVLLLQEVRSQIGYNSAVIIVNSNQNTVPLSA